MTDRYTCPSCGTTRPVPSLAREHCIPVGYDSQGSPIYRWQTKEHA